MEKLVLSAKEICEQLKIYLHEKCRIENEKLSYLYPVMEHLKKEKCNLDIFSMNYDLVVEVLCEEFLIPYTDGFLVNWEPRLFMDSRFMVRLFKLHGSFDWYQSESGDRMKIPILQCNKEAKYLAQNKIISMMVYPRQEKREPFNELLRMFRNRLLTLDKLVLIGYSFRDERIFQMILEGLKKNRGLQLEIVSPNAADFYRFFCLDNRVNLFSGGVAEWVQFNF